MPTHGDYQVTVTVADDDGGASMASFTVHVQGRGVKFFVVDNAAHDTFRYDLDGNPIGQSELDGKNARPRGVASNAAGDTLWVVDANKKVYVYSASGSLLGSWSAGSLNQPQDITTNGTDIWIVDNATDRVYRYAKAAQRRSGSQSPTDSFVLDSQDSHPSGIVTDGTTFWVTDDFNHKNNVFVYGPNGTKLGAWLLDAANDAPSGITLNPSGGTDLWVVDRHDALVYHYAGATTRRDGSQAATDSFTLSPLDQHPEGIADPRPLGNPLAVLTTTAPSFTIYDDRTIVVAPAIICDNNIDPGPWSNGLADMLRIAPIPFMIFEANLSAAMELQSYWNETFWDQLVDGALRDVPLDSMARSLAASVGLMNHSSANQAGSIQHDEIKSFWSEMTVPGIAADFTDFLFACDPGSMNNSWNPLSSH